MYHNCKLFTLIKIAVTPIINLYDSNLVISKNSSYAEHALNLNDMKLRESIKRCKNRNMDYHYIMWEYDDGEAKVILLS
jgi:hypothetical protein